MVVCDIFKNLHVCLQYMVVVVSVCVCVCMHTRVCVWVGKGHYASGLDYLRCCPLSQGFKIIFLEMFLNSNFLSNLTYSVELQTSL